MTSLTDRVGGYRSSLGRKAPCYLASTGNLTLSAFKAVDGTTPTSTHANLRILVKSQTAGAENGVYVMASAAWARAKDFSSNNDFVTGTEVYVHSGSAASGLYRVTSSDPHTIDSSTVTFSTV